MRYATSELKAMAMYNFIENPKIEFNWELSNKLDELEYELKNNILTKYENVFFISGHVHTGINGPLVENAFVHGISRVEEGGCVKLHIWMEEDNLMISIADNGLGMSPERLEEVRESLKTSENFSRGIGVGNICRRIHMLYEQGEFEIDSQEHQGTVVKITIPQGQR